MERSRRTLLLLAALNGLLAVAFGAFAAHGVANPQAQAWLQTGSQYQLTHALAVIGTLALLPGAAARLPALLFTLGALIFAGTLYAMALGGPRLLGAVTPIGGTLMILGWLALARAALKGMR